MKATSANTNNLCGYISPSEMPRADNGEGLVANEAAGGPPQSPGLELVVAVGVLSPLPNRAHA